MCYLLKPIFKTRIKQLEVKGWKKIFIPDKIFQIKIFNLDKILDFTLPKKLKRIFWNLAYFALDPFPTLSSYSHWYRGSGSCRLPVIWRKSSISKRLHWVGREVSVFQPFSQCAGTCVQWFLPCLYLKGLNKSSLLLA